MDRIVKIELTPVFVPFHEDVLKLMQNSKGGLGMAIAAEEPWTGGDFVICKLIDNHGNTGVGEIFLWLPESGTSPDQVIDVIQNGLCNYVLGESPFNTEKIRRLMENNVTRNEMAKGLIDMACYDLMGKITGRSAHDFMGGQTVDEIPLAALIPLMGTDAMIDLCLMFFDGGMRTFRVKLGQSIEHDVEVISGIREKLGNNIRLRVDYNQAYSPPEAVRAIRAIEPYHIDFAEQPVAADNYPGMAYVQKSVDTPIMSHEGCFSLQDITTLVNLGGIGIIGLNSERPGGVTGMLRAISYAETQGMGAVLHNQPLGIASAMHIHVAAARHYSLGHATELFGQVMMEDDLIVKPINYDNGTAKVPEGPGWGVELDEGALNKYAVSSAVIIN
ncbi:MAG: mandelate racemase/muconate lactonizing enzyme family protein [Deltaproteobacteria bacterium]|nr:mandelate racemase/muconate lactonizing enzyme family protein [Deltaproteobacteria bacterium]